MSVDEAAQLAAVARAAEALSESEVPQVKMFALRLGAQVDALRDSVLVVDAPEPPGDPR